MYMENFAEPERINEEEYMFLSDNLDPLGITGKKEICSFLCYSRRHMIAKLLHLAIDEQLSPIQRDIIKMLWFDNISATAAAEKLGVSKSTVTRQSQKAYDILKNCLKYVLLYQFDNPADTVSYFKEAVQYDKRH